MGLQYNRHKTVSFHVVDGALIPVCKPLELIFAQGAAATPLTCINKGAEARRKLLTKYSITPLSANLHCDLFQQNKPLIT